jgi:hypothetical protein
VSGTVALGHALVATGSVLVFLSAALDGATNDLRTTRRVGRVALVVGGWLAHPLVALHRRLGETPTARCARAGHRRTWDGYHERCTRCERRLLVTCDGERSREEWTYPDDPRIVPEPLRPPRSSWRVGLDDDVASALRAYAARLERDALRLLDASPVRSRDPADDPEVVELVVRRNRERPTRTERLELEQRRDELGRRRRSDNPWRW